MSKFDYSTYSATVNAAANKSKASGIKVGFLKLGPDSSALARINLSDISQLDFSTVHKVKRNPDDKFCGMSVSCLNPIGSYDEDNCPFCKAAAEGNINIQKAAKRVFIQMMVAYRKADGTFEAPVPVIFERPAGFSRELATKLKDYGDLRKVLFKITRTGAGLDTRYSFDYAMPNIFKPELIPEDFSAFDNFDISKHSYWVKTKEDLEYYVANGAFPEITNEAQKASANAPVAETIVKPAEVKLDTPFETPEAVKATITPNEFVSTVNEPKAEEKPVETPKPTNFGGFSF